MTRYTRELSTSHMEPDGCRWVRLGCGTGRSTGWRGGVVNAVSYERDRVEPEEWDRPEMRTALGARDITRIYRLLQRIGFSQQKIAALTGQSQPEVSAIIHGRKVMAYDVLARIADGLGVPRGYMGLAYMGRSLRGALLLPDGSEMEPAAGAESSARGGAAEAPV